MLRPIISLLSAFALQTASGQAPAINEFMASNGDTLAVADGSNPDWIEIHNPGSTTLDLAGWHLTDDSLNLTRWTFPAGTSLAPDSLLLVYASGLNLLDPAGELHTNFKLSQAGEYLALVAPSGIVQQEFAPTYPEQLRDVSFGLPPTGGAPAYFTTPTPGAQNAQAMGGIVKDTKFSVDRGFYDQAFEVIITSATPGAAIYYTTDGTQPTFSSTRVDAPDEFTPPSATVSITDTTVLRAFAGRTGWIPTNIDTQTYLFLDEVIGHENMSTTITQHPEWGPQMRDALLELPSISLVTQDGQDSIPLDQPSIRSPEEVPISIEMIFPDGRDGFQANAGAERFGGQHTLFDGNKKNLRISFKRIYGPSRLNFNLFDDVDYGAESAVNRFDQILLRNGSHDSLFAPQYAHSRGIYFRNRYFFDRQLEAGHLSMRGKFVHVYLNGEYYGHYHLMERPTADFMATYQGGEEGDYDIMKGRSGVFAIQGNTVAWDYLRTNTNNWEIVQDYMDVDNYIDYMLLNFYGGNKHDWYPSHNWVAGRKREPGSKFQFFMWDNDCLVRRGGDSTTASPANVVTNGGPGNMFPALLQHEEFKRRLADRAQELFYNGGMLSKERVKADFTQLAQGISRTIIPETARWATSAPVVYNPDLFQTYVDWVVDVNGEERGEITIGQMRAARAFPNIDAPSLSHYGGEIAAGTPVALDHNEGTLYYTTDGTDPRMGDGSVNPNATLVGGALFPNTVLEKGATWKYDDSKVAPSPSWMASDFDDSSWSEGHSPIGFGSINGANIATTAFSGTSNGMTFYARKTFNVSGASDFLEASVNLIYDDGVVLYLNGQEIVRQNLPTGTITIDTPANANGNEDDYENFPFDPALLVEGENTLAIEVHNRGSGNNDMVFDLELLGEVRNPNRFVSFNDTTILKTRVLHDGEWSALTEATFITDVPATAGNLVISEIHYHPDDSQNGDSEFIELMNIASERISLAGVSFTDGISYTFGEQSTLEAGERVILVYDQAIFENSFGPGLPVGGVFSPSRLSNGGERLTLTAADGSLIETLNYGDREPWPTPADGAGYSLVRVAPSGGGDGNQAQNWRTSIAPGGTPGSSDSTPYDPSSGQSLLQYATGSESGGSIEFIGTSAVFEYRRIHGADDARIEVQVSSDLENWSTSGVTFIGQSNLPDDSAHMRWLLPTPEDTQVFTRLVVTLIP